MWLIFFLANLIILFYLFRKYTLKRYRLAYQSDSLQEKINISSAENALERKNNLALQQKITRYNSLKKIIEEINRNLDLDSVADSLMRIAFSLIADNKGSCILYLVDSETQNLAIFKTKKEKKDLAIRAKQGDIFDLWVLRHGQPLLVEDIKKDFRFDLEKLKTQDQLRPVSSLISAPFISENRFLGILRLDNPQANFYTQDDLRFLAKICDLGGVALENSELYRRTQELAIHDGLTGLFTKGYFLGRLKDECKRAVHQKKGFSLLMLDIDLFKNYNDKFGHTAGDIVLKKISRITTDSLKGSNSVISRFGGEEFCVILPGIGKLEACDIADNLRGQIEREKTVLRRQETHVSVSVGVAAFPDDAAEEGGLIMRADRLMYEAKQKGRNRVCCS